MWAISTPLDDPHDEGETAANLAEADRQISLRCHLMNTQILEDQDIDEEGRVHCLDCPAIIPPERMEKVPYAVRCVGCQEEHERRQCQTGKRRP